LFNPLQLVLLRLKSKVHTTNDVAQDRDKLRKRWFVRETNTNKKEKGIKLIFAYLELKTTSEYSDE